MLKNTRKMSLILCGILLTSSLSFTNVQAATAASMEKNVSASAGDLYPLQVNISSSGILTFDRVSGAAYYKIIYVKLGVNAGTLDIISSQSYNVGAAFADRNFTPGEYAFYVCPMDKYGNRIDGNNGMILTQWDGSTFDVEYY